MQENKRQLGVADFRGGPECGSLGGGELSFFFFSHLKNFIMK